jgi:NAD(P)-dependent dehydrogenase (short-subunit alcohol dehydrogenase family)
MSDALRLEVARQGVRVAIVKPGPVDTGARRWRRRYLCLHAVAARGSGRQVRGALGRRWPGNARAAGPLAGTVPAAAAERPANALRARAGDLSLDGTPLANLPSFLE